MLVKAPLEEPAVSLPFSPRALASLQAALTHLLLGLGVGLLGAQVLVQEGPDETQVLQHGSATASGSITGSGSGQGS